MTHPTDIEALRALLAAATPGPWTTYNGSIIRVESDWIAACDGDRSTDMRDEANARCIIAAVNALPAILNELAVWRQREDWIGDLNQELIARAAELAEARADIERLKRLLVSAGHAAQAFSKSMMAREDVLDAIRELLRTS